MSEKRIKAAKVSLAAYDVSGKTLNGVADYQYLELKVAEGQEFGANKAIVMPDPVTRSFAVTAIVVVFEDGSVWESTSPLLALPNPQQLQHTLNEAELAKQYRMETTFDSSYAPQEAYGLWQCACGRWNGGHRCTKCKTSKEKVFSAFELSFLTDRTSHRLEQERLQHEAELARQAQLTAEAERKRKLKQKRLKVAIFIVLILAVLIGIASAIYAKSKELTIEKMFACSAKEDIINLLGLSDEDGRYNVSFLGDDYSLFVDYEETLVVNNWSLIYFYPGVRNLDYLVSGYVPTDKERSAATNAALDVLTSFTKKFGNPEKITTGNVQRYTWIVDARKIDLIDYSNAYSNTPGAVYVEVNCNLQSFCEHTYSEEENIKPTCTEDGYSKKICSACGYREEKSLPKTGHTMLDATCTSSPVCSICSYTNGSPLGHAGSSGHCTRCGEQLAMTLEQLQGTWLFRYNDGSSKKLIVSGTSATYEMRILGQSFYQSYVGTIQITNEGFRLHGIHSWHYRDGTQKIVDDDAWQFFSIVGFTETSFTEDSGWTFLKS